jgi:hypothetical protein
MTLPTLRHGRHRFQRILAARDAGSALQRRDRRRRAILEAVATRKEKQRSPVHPRDDDRAGGPAAETRASPGGTATVEEMSEWSFPASDPPSTWNWEVPETAESRSSSQGDRSKR